MKIDSASLNSPSCLTRRSALRSFALAAGATAIPGVFGGPLLRAKEPAALPTTPPPAFTTTTLGEGITVLNGAVCNILVVHGEDGGLVIDSGIPELATATASQIAQLAPQLSTLVNTHWHFDHTGGNERLGRAGARIVAHANCRQRLSTDQFTEALNKKSPPSPKLALPVVTITAETSLHLNDETFRLIPVPPAHTDGDIIVRLEKANVVAFGDLFFHKMYPFIDYSSGGWIGGLVNAVRTGLSLIDEKTQIVPGHGPVATPSDLRSYLTFLETITERLTKLKTEGKTLDEAVAAEPAKDFDETLGKGFLNAEKFVRITYTGLLKHG